MTRPRVLQPSGAARRSAQRLPAFKPAGAVVDSHGVEREIDFIEAPVGLLLRRERLPSNRRLKQNVAANVSYLTSLSLFVTMEMKGPEMASPFP
jgi:hypothetical protein